MVSTRLRRIGLRFAEDPPTASLEEPHAFVNLPAFPADRFDIHIVAELGDSFLPRLVSVMGTGWDRRPPDLSSHGRTHS